MVEEFDEESEEELEMVEEEGDESEDEVQVETGNDAMVEDPVVATTTPVAERGTYDTILEEDLDFTI